MESNEEFNHDGVRPSETFETMALQKKRTRRVSFAEMTSVHFFDRDEDFNERHLLKTENLVHNSCEVAADVNSGHSKVLGGNDDSDSEGDVNDNVDEEMEFRRSFLHPSGSPSTGGSTFGSASSNDEENFFGPVSAKFIRPGRFSGSAASDDDCDMTMDSTAFSMHYRSIARSDSGVDSKTPARDQFHQEETPKNDVTRSHMVYTLDKKIARESVINTGELSCKASFSDMSLIEKNPNVYEYERLLLESDVLLGEIRNEVLQNKISIDIATPAPNGLKEDDQKKVDHGAVSAGSRNISSEPFSISPKQQLNEFAAHSEKNAYDGPSPRGHSNSVISLSRLGTEVNETESHIMWYSLSNREPETRSKRSTSPVNPGQDLFLNTPPEMHLHANSRLLNEPGSLWVVDDKAETSLQKSISKTSFIEKSVPSPAFSAKPTLKALGSQKSLVSGMNHHALGISYDDSVAELKPDTSHQFEEMNSTSRVNGQHAEDESVHENSPSKCLHPIVGQKSPDELGPKDLSPSTRRGTVASQSIMTQGENVLVRSIFGSKLFPDSSTLHTAPQKSPTDANISVVVDKGDAVSEDIIGVLSSPFGRGKHEQSSEIHESAHSTLVEDKVVERSGGNDCVVSHYKEASRLDSEPFDSSNLITKRSLIFKSEPTNFHHGVTVQGADASCTTPQALDKLSLKKNLVGSPSLNSIRWSGFPDTTKVRKESVLRSQSEVKVIPKSPKRLKVDGWSTGISLFSDAASMSMGRSNCIDVHSKIHGMKICIPESAVEISGEMIDTLEDVLLRKERSRMYDVLCHEVMPLNTISCDDLSEKIAETKSVLHRVLFEKSKLELKRLKKDLILKKLHLVSSSLQESRELRTDLNSQLSLIKQISGVKKIDEVSQEKVTAISRIIDSLELEISTLMRRSHDHCEMETEPSSSVIIDTDLEHLIKRTSRRFVRSDMQNWVVQSLAGLSSKQNIMVNYLDVIIQSIQIREGVKSHGSTTSFILNEAKILKMFPNMEACSAFSFVFNAENLKGGFRDLISEIEVSSCLLSNLVEVVEEVQFCQIELHNLTDARFCSPSVEELHLMLCFFEFECGRKLRLTLDMACLKRGVYPADVTPSVDDPVVKKAINIETAGSLRILRLCRSISQILLHLDKYK